MRKEIGPICLVAGTCIGSGVIALPLILARLGLVPGILFMFLTWSVMYYTALVNVELNLQANQGLSLGALGKLFSGKKAEFLGLASLKLLSYALLAVFIYGGASVTQKLLLHFQLGSYTMPQMIAGYTIGASCLLSFPIRLIDYINRFLFTSLIVVFSILILGLCSNIHYSNLPLITSHIYEFSTWCKVLPVVFTSFGFQVIFHTLTNYCGKNKNMLKNAFLWGSLIPAIVYILWTCGALSVIYHHNPVFYDSMIQGKVEVGSLVEKLSEIAQWPFLQMLVWWISILAIVTSILGVGIGLVDSLNVMLEKKVKTFKHLTSVLITTIPSAVVAILVPNAFIAVLGFAGMILSIIAILLPIYLLTKAQFSSSFYKETTYKSLLCISVVFGFMVIVAELFNMVH